MLSLNGREEASTRYRFLQYAPELERRGHRHRVSTFYLSLPGSRRSRREKLSSWLRGFVRQTLSCAGASRFDLVVVQRFICPYVLNELVRIVPVPVIYDFDDAVWLAEPPRWAAHADPGATFRELCQRARMVIAGNDFLAEHARQHAPLVRVVPTVVDTARFTPGTRTESGPPLIGWIGSPSTFPFLRAKLALLDEIAALRPLRLRVVGAPERIRLRHVEVEQPAWSEAQEPALFADLDIGLYPLSDDVWSRGKCALKSIQYMSCAVAHVASPVGVVREACSDGEQALFATDDAAWRTALLRLIDDAELRRQLGAAGRARAAEQYSLSRWARPLVSLYEEAVKP